MKKYFLVALLLLVFAGFVNAEEGDSHTFAKQSQILATEVFPEIRQYLKKVDLYPYTQKKGDKVVLLVEKIIILNDKLSMAKKPVVELLGIVKGDKIYFQISVLIPLLDNEKVLGERQIMIFGKYFFVKSYKIIKKSNEKKLST